MLASLLIYLCSPQQCLLKRSYGRLGLWGGSLCFLLAWAVLTLTKSAMTALFMVGLLSMVLWSVGPLCAALFQHMMARHKETSR